VPSGVATISSLLPLTGYWPVPDGQLVLVVVGEPQVQPPG